MVIFVACEDNRIIELYHNEEYTTEISLSDFQQEFLESHYILSYFNVNDNVFVEYKNEDDISYFQHYLSKLSESSLEWTIGPDSLDVIDHTDTDLVIRYHNNAWDDFGQYHIDMDTGEISYHVKLGINGIWEESGYYYTVNQIENPDDSEFNYTYNVIKVGENSEEVIYSYQADWSETFNHLGNGYFYVMYELPNRSDVTKIIDPSGHEIDVGYDHFDAIALDQSFLIIGNNEDFILYDYQLDIINQLSFDLGSNEYVSYYTTLEDGILIRERQYYTKLYHKMMYNGEMERDIEYTEEELTQINDPITLIESVLLVQFKNQDRILLGRYDNANDKLYRIDKNGNVQWELDYEYVRYFDIIDDNKIFVNTSYEHILLSFDGEYISTVVIREESNTEICNSLQYHRRSDTYSCIDFHKQDIVVYNGNHEEVWRNEDLVQVFSSQDTSFNTYLVRRSDEYYEHPFYGPTYYVLLDNEGNLVKSYKDEYSFSDVFLYNNRTFFIGSQDSTDTIGYRDPIAYEIDAQGNIIDQRKLIQTTSYDDYMIYWILDGSKIIKYHVPR